MPEVSGVPAGTVLGVKYLAAYLLLTKAGNDSPSKKDVSSVLEAAGVEVEDEKLDKLLSELEGKTVSELIEEGKEKLSSVPAAGPAAAASSGDAAEEKADEEEEEEEEEESDSDMGMGLFD